MTLETDIAAAHDGHRRQSWRHFVLSVPVMAFVVVVTVEVLRDTLRPLLIRLRNEQVESRSARSGVAR